MSHIHKSIHGWEWMPIRVNVEPALQLAQDIVDKQHLQQSLGSEWRWWKYVVDYHAREMTITEVDLIEKASPFSDAGSMAHYAIAVKAMGNGQMDKAKEYFANTIATRRVGFWNYHWSKVYLKHLNGHSFD